MDNEKLIEELARAQAVADMAFDETGEPLWKEYIETASATIPIIARLVADAHEAGARAMQGAVSAYLKDQLYGWPVRSHIANIDLAQFREVKS